MRTLLLSTAALLCAALVGCSSNADSPKLVTADGVVTYLGHPLPDATVMFAPEKGPIATGVTDLDGHFTLSTGSRNGVAVGKANVAITAGTPAQDTSEALPKPKNAEEAQAYLEKAGQMQQQMIQQGGPAQRQSAIPEKYAKMSTSGLSYDVQASGENHFEITLE